MLMKNEEQGNEKVNVFRFRSIAKSFLPHLTNYVSADIYYLIGACLYSFKPDSCTNEGSMLACTVVCNLFYFTVIAFAQFSFEIKFVRRGGFFFFRRTAFHFS